MSNQRNQRRGIAVSWAGAEGRAATLIGVIAPTTERLPGGFRYLDSYNGPPISPHLDYQTSQSEQPRFFPLSAVGQGHLRDSERDDLHQVFLSALPGDWGRTVMASHSPTYVRASPFEKLWMLDERRVGALQFTPTTATNPGQWNEFIEGLEALEAVRKQVREFSSRLFATKRIPFAIGTERQKWALTVNSGITPKCAFKLENSQQGEEYVAKFSQENLSLYDEVAVEAAMLDLSLTAGLDTVLPMPVECSDGSSVLCTRRFDTREDGTYKHVINAATALDLPLNAAADYTDVAAFLRESGSKSEEDVSELYGRMLFNAYINNTDDHLGQFEFLMDEGGDWSLAPNLDLLVDVTAPGGQHKLTMAGAGTVEHSLDWIDQRAEAMGVPREQAREIGERIVQALVVQWEGMTTSNGVDTETRAELEQAMQYDQLVLLHREMLAARTLDDTAKHSDPAPRMGM